MIPRILKKLNIALSSKIIDLSLWGVPVMLPFFFFAFKRVWIITQLSGFLILPCSYNVQVIMRCTILSSSISSYFIPDNRLHRKYIIKHMESSNFLPLKYRFTLPNTWSCPQSLATQETHPWNTREQESANLQGWGWQGHCGKQTKLETDQSEKIPITGIRLFGRSETWGRPLRTQSWQVPSGSPMGAFSGAVVAWLGLEASHRESCGTWPASETKWESSALTWGRS